MMIECRSFSRDDLTLRADAAECRYYKVEINLTILSITIGQLASHYISVEWVGPGGLVRLYPRQVR